MRGFLAVARREIAERRFVFAAAAVASLVPFTVPIVRGLHGQTAAEARDWTAVLLAATFAAGLATALGATIIASDLAEHRFGFYFSRPLSGFAIWAGKIGAACVIALSTAAIVYVPTLAANKGRIILVDLPKSTPQAFLFGVFAAVVLCHAAAVALRQRSSMLALDMAALILLSLALGFLTQRFFLAFAIEALKRAANMFGAVATLAVVLAGLVGVMQGRSDGRAAHRALSATLWGVLGVGVAAIAGYAAWVFAAGPRDLKSVDWTLPASKGNWIVVQGMARDMEPSFLYDTATGRYQRAGALWHRPILSPDGAHAAWLEGSGLGGPLELMTWKLDDPNSKPLRTGLYLSATPIAFLSEHGDRLATIEGGLLSIHDTSSGASLASARIGERFYPRGFFLDRNRFRIFRKSNTDMPGVGSHIDILEFDVSTKTLATTGSIEDVDEIAYSATPSGDRLFVREKSRLTLRDGRSGKLLASLVERSPANRTLGRFVSDGRIVVSVADESGARVEVFAQDGRHERTIRIPARDRIALGGEVAPGGLVVAAGGDTKQRENRTIFLADLSSGQVRQVADHLFPVTYLAGWISNSPNYQPEPGSEATKLFYSPGRRSLVHFDPLTGERRVLLGKTSER
jgi:hypothetical protein